jgi:hypothetical protein
MRIIAVLMLLLPVLARADTTISRVFSADKNVYLRVLLEKPNGFDIRSLTIPKTVIEKAEKQGKEVRPTRTSTYVFSYWAFLADGSFKTFEKYNYGPAKVDDKPLSFAELEDIFLKIPPAGKWKKDSDLFIGATHFSVRLLNADDLEIGGKKGEIEIGWLKNGKPIYYYFCAPIEK